MILKPESFGNPIRETNITNIYPEVLLWGLL